MADDPGFSYLYSKGPKLASSGSGARHRAGATGASPVASPLGRPQQAQRRAPGGMTPPPGAPGGAASSKSGHLAALGQLGRWDAALRNVEDARTALDSLSLAVDDAVYLDEDAYNQVQPKVAYLKTIQAQQGRIATLTAETRELQQRLTTAEHAQRQSNQQVKEVSSELENNSNVFKLHYSELIAKDAEIQRLKAVIEGLSSGRKTI